MADLVEKPKPMNAADVRRALKSAFSHPTHGIVYEVARGTGMNANRHLDAMVMGLWPSRGLDLTGVEIKVSRADFRREIEQPQKAEELAQYCDFFVIAAPAGLVPIVEMPDKWGLYEISNKGKLVITKPPTRHQAMPPTKQLLAAIFRAANREAGADDIDAAVTAHKEKLNVEFAERLDRRLKAEKPQENRDALSWQALKEKLGGEIDEKWLADANVIAAISAVYRSKIASPYHGLESLHETLSAAIVGVGNAMSAFGIPQKEKKLL